MQSGPLRINQLLYAINTHYHWDHTNGNTIFREVGATVIAREMTKDFMVNRSPRQEAFLRSRGFTLGDPPFLPQQTFTHETELDLGNQPLHLVHLGKAETDDATAIRVPAEDCIVSGDTVMTGSFPIFGQPVMNEGLMANHDWINLQLKNSGLMNLNLSYPDTDPWHMMPKLTCCLRSSPIS